MADEQTKFRSGLNTPMKLVGSDPDKDQWVGQDELGNDIYKHAVSGKKYTVAPVIEGKGLAEKASDVYEAIPPMEEWEAPSFDEVMTTAKGFLGGVVDGAVSAVQAPSNPDASLGDVWGTASGMAAGGRLASGGVPEGAEGMFVGVRDTSKIRRAKEMKDNGFSSQEIAMKEGIRMNPQGIWVEEISDKDFRLQPNFASAARRSEQSVVRDMGMAVEHPELMSRYPKLQNDPLILVDKKDGPAYLGSDTVQGKFNPRTRELFVRKGGNPDVILHELQHYVQKEEGWDGGANSSEIMDSVNSTYDNLPQEGKKYLLELSHLGRAFSELEEAERVLSNPDKSGWGVVGMDRKTAERVVAESDGFIQDQLDLLAPLRQDNPEMAGALDDLFGITLTDKVMPDQAHDIYQRNYGEWEARTVQDRKDMTDAERLANDPFANAPEGSWTGRDFRKVLRKVDEAITKSRGQSTYGDEMMKLPKGYAEGGMVMNPEEAGAAPEVPVGALPSEVADDVDIKVSEGEYVIPANVVRYLGLEKIESLVNKAKEGLAEKEAEGRIGGDTEPEAPPDQSAQGLDAQMASAIPQMAEGGLVQDNFTGTREYTSADGRKFPVRFTNGKPSTPIPAGATPVEGSDTSPTPATSALTEGEGRSGSMAAGHGGVSGTLADGVSRWSPEQFGQYEKGLGGVGEKIGGVLAGTLLGPLGKMAVDARQSYLKETVPDTMKKMIETGIDPQGKKLSTEQVQSLKDIQGKIAAKEAAATDQKKGPLGQIGAALGVAKGLMTPMGAISAGVKAIQGKVGAPSAPTSGAASNPYGHLAGGGRDGFGSTLGKSDEEQGKANAASGNGGLYSKGGLVTRTPTPMPKYGKGGLVTRKKKK